MERSLEIAEPEERPKREKRRNTRKAITWRNFLMCC